MCVCVCELCLQVDYKPASRAQCVHIHYLTLGPHCLLVQRVMAAHTRVPTQATHQAEHIDGAFTRVNVLLVYFNVQVPRLEQPNRVAPLTRLSSEGYRFRVAPIFTMTLAWI